jgi:hypothetical protein
VRLSKKRRIATMPSPFPGIDPYLEDQAYWEDFHARLIVYLCDALNDILPEHYEARLQERISLVEAHDVWIEIRRRPDRSVASVIEILSLTNRSGTGYEDYLAKRTSLIRERINLIELNLLVQGKRFMRRPLPPGEYFAFIARADGYPVCEVYAWSIRQPLPTIPIPLLSPDEDLTLALDGIFTSAYDRGRYARSIDYSRPLKLPISIEDRAWAEKIARDTAH